MYSSKSITDGENRQATGQEQIPVTGSKYQLVSITHKGRYKSLRKRTEVQRSSQGPWTGTSRGATPAGVEGGGRDLQASGRTEPQTLRTQGAADQAAGNPNQGAAGSVAERAIHPQKCVLPPGRGCGQPRGEQARGRQRPRGTGSGTTGAATTGPQKHQEEGPP